MQFTKMQGLGNDYVYVNCFEETVEDPSRVALAVSDRHFGIGSDGLILIKPSKVADCQMDMYNMDGSRGAMCGNGIRCVGKYAYDHHLVDKTDITVETASGIKKLHLQVGDGKVTAVTVDMGKPEITSQIPEKITVDGKEYHFTGVSMGNPHAVLFLDCDDGVKEDGCREAGTPEQTAGKNAPVNGGFGGVRLEDLDLEKLGPGFENHTRFPDRTNTEFVRVVDRTHVKMRVWERGSGETMACGTGACAVAVASILAGYTEDTVEVELLGGTLTITWDRERDTVWMTGPAAEVFSGEYDISGLGSPSGTL